MKKIIYFLLISILVFNFSALAEENLKLIGWTYEVDTWNHLLDVFEDQYGIKTDDFYNIPSDNYYEKLVASFISGTEYDVIVVRDSNLAAWASAGWLEPIDGFEGVERYKEEIPDGALAQMSYEGHLYGLPYYAGRYVFVYNEEHLKKAGIDNPPKTWDELLEQARIIKEKGISEHPIIFIMTKSSNIMENWEQLIFSRGGKLFNESHDPLFNEGDSAAFEALEWLKGAMKEGLLDQASLSSTTADVNRAMAAGTRTFTLLSDYNVAQLNDPKSSQAAGKIKMALVPGNDKVISGTTSYIRLYCISKNSKQKENAWKLVQFLGGRDKNDDYYTGKYWALNFGLGFVQKPLYEDKEVSDYITKWGDPDIIKKQDEYAGATPYRFTPWFDEWQTNAWGELQKAVLGEKPIEIILKDLEKSAKELKADY
ncbi:MAG: sugar ABC transporter substrate-binding protein [Atribacterota bacterium]|nr:sugar ABC transporter substrate-binding protein [Atribacterota bacterium]MDD5637747.1 sugar ABC transporter substrate-binding protein [Atribacterota bacterium]